MTESMTEKKIRTRKAVIIGAGRVGSHSALCLMFQHLVNEIVFLDVNEEAARAQALDLEDLASGLGTPSRFAWETTLTAPTRTS